MAAPTWTPTYTTPQGENDPAASWNFLGNERPAGYSWFPNPAQNTMANWGAPDFSWQQTPTSMIDATKDVYNPAKYWDTLDQKTMDLEKGTTARTVNGVWTYDPAKVESDKRSLADEIDRLGTSAIDMSRLNTPGWSFSPSNPLQPTPTSDDLKGLSSIGLINPTYAQPSGSGWAKGLGTLGALVGTLLPGIATATSPLGAAGSFASNLGGKALTAGLGAMSSGAAGSSSGTQNALAAGQTVDPATGQIITNSLSMPTSQAYNALTDSSGGSFKDNLVTRLQAPQKPQQFRPQQFRPIAYSV